MYKNRKACTSGRHLIIFLKNTAPDEPTEKKKYYKRHDGKVIQTLVKEK